MARTVQLWSCALPQLALLLAASALSRAAPRRAEPRCSCAAPPPLLLEESHHPHHRLSSLLDAHLCSFLNRTEPPHTQPRLCWAAADEPLGSSSSHLLLSGSLQRGVQQGGTVGVTGRKDAGCWLSLVTMSPAPHTGGWWLCG